MTEKDLRRYLRQAEARLVCSPARRREFEAFARQSLEEFAAENPDADYTACLKQFGTPESTAAQFMAQAQAAPPSAGHCGGCAGDCGAGRDCRVLLCDERCGDYYGEENTNHHRKYSRRYDGRGTGPNSSNTNSTEHSIMRSVYG